MKVKSRESTGESGVGLHCLVALLDDLLMLAKQTMT